MSNGLQELNGAAVSDSALMAIVTLGSLTGSMLPFVLKRLGVESRPLHRCIRGDFGRCHGGLVIYVSIAYVVLRGTLLCGDPQATSSAPLSGVELPPSA